MDDVTYEEIAEQLDFKTYSAVIKRIKRIGKAYQQFAGVDLGFKQHLLRNRQVLFFAPVFRQKYQDL